MDAQDTMRLMFDTMDSYDRGDFDRLGEIYAEDARWTNAVPNGPHSPAGPPNVREASLSEPGW